MTELKVMLQHLRWYKSSKKLWISSYTNYIRKNNKRYTVSKQLRKKNWNTDKFLQCTNREIAGRES